MYLVSNHKRLCVLSLSWLNGYKKLLSFFVLIKFEHSIFALPFAYIGGLIGRQEIMPFYYWFWVTMACISARTAAMLLNRIIDLEIDRQNPRTKERPLITGKIKFKSAIFVLILSIFLFLFSSYKLNLTCLFLSPIVLFLISSYPYTKRFTWFSHFYLGICLSCAPIGGCLATSGGVNLSSLIIGLFVILWVSGFDIIYSILDIEFDKKHNLHSIPQKFGLKKRASNFPISPHPCWFSPYSLWDISLFWMDIFNGSNCYLCPSHKATYNYKR